MEIIGVIMSLGGSLLVKETRSLLLKFLHYFWLSDKLLLKKESVQNFNYW